MSTGIQFIEMRHIQAKKWSCCLEEKTTADEQFDKWKNEKYENSTVTDITVIDFTIALKLGPNLKIIERTRYHVWNLLADVGGFNDGLHLVGFFLISSYASFSFKQSILKNVKVDG